MTNLFCEYYFFTVLEFRVRQVELNVQDVKIRPSLSTRLHGGNNTTDFITVAQTQLRSLMTIKYYAMTVGEMISRQS